MNDLFDDDDLFAIKPTAKPDWSAIAPPIAPAPPPQHIDCIKRCLPLDTADHPVASFACFCGFRDEVKEPAPPALDCVHCGGMESLRRYAPRYLPPENGGRSLTREERRAIDLDRA